MSAAEDELETAKIYTEPVVQIRCSKPLAALATTAAREGADASSVIIRGSVRIRT